MEPGSWLTLQLEPNQLDASGYTITNENHMSQLTSTKKGSRLKAIHKNKELTMSKHSPPQKNELPSIFFSPLKQKNGWKVHQMDVK